jgi:hypothetical protein
MKFFCAALCVATLVLPCQAMAGQSWEEQSTATAFLAADHAASAPAGFSVRAMPEPYAGSDAAAARAFFTNFVATMPSGNSVPCFSCVNGTQAGTLGMDDPYNFVATGSSQTFLVSWTSLTFKGTCTVAVSVAAGTKIVESFKHTFTNLGTGAYDAWWVTPAVSFAGPAIVVGKVTCGGKTSSSKAPIVFQ